MDIIQCMTCGERWTHGASPDHGGAAAYTHLQMFQNTDQPHKILVGDANVLAELRAKESN